MGIMPDVSPCGSQTVTGPGWPNVDEDALASAAASYEALATKLSGTVVPQQQGQLMKLSANTTELANTLGVPPNIPQTGAPPTPPGAQQAAGQDPQQAMQMLSQDADAFSDGVTGGSAAAADQSATNVSPYSARRHTTAPW